MKKLGNFCTIIFSYLLLTCIMIMVDFLVSGFYINNARNYILATGIRCMITVLGYLISAYVLVILKRKTSGSDREKKTEKRQAKEPRIIMKLLFSAAAFIFIFLFSFLIGKNFPGENSQEFYVVLNSAIGIYKIPVLFFIVLRHVILPAVCEELYFRGALFSSLTDVCGFRLYGAVIFSSLIFCISHTGRLPMILFSFLSGIIFCILVRFCRSTGYSIAVHLIYNLIILLLIIL